MAKNINKEKFRIPDIIESVLPKSFVSVSFYEDNVTKTHYTFDGKVMQNEEFIKKFFDLIAFGIKISNENKVEIKVEKRKK